MTDNKEKAPSMEEILQTIRGVVTGQENQGQSSKDGEKSAEDDVLELTEVIAQDGSLESIAPKDQSNNIDILGKIDNALGIDKNPNTDTSADKDVTNPNPNDPLNIIEAALNEPPNTKDTVEQLPPETTISNEAVDDITKEQSELANNINKKINTSLLSEKSASDSIEAFRVLVKKTSRPISDSPTFRSGNTVEDLIIELIKPQLSAWLDANLPSIVKHVVEKEVQKLIPREDE
jgi:cell pole-organizing protein PopZ